MKTNTSMRKRNRDLVRTKMASRFGSGPPCHMPERDVVIRCFFQCVFCLSCWKFQWFRLAFVVPFMCGFGRFSLIASVRFHIEARKWGFATSVSKQDRAIMAKHVGSAFFLYAFLGVRFGHPDLSRTTPHKSRSACCGILKV